MGVKRISRGKLFDTEKLGINVLGTIGVSDGMKDAIVSATQHREGYKIITDIVVDLGSSKTTVKSGGTSAAQPVGTLSDAGSEELSYLAKLDASVFGVVTSLETHCLEKPTDGVLTGANAYKLAIGDANGKIGTAVTNLVTIGSDMNSIGDAVGRSRATSVSGGGFLPSEGGLLADKYVYIVGGSAVNTAVGTATAKITVGSGAVTGSFVDEITRITLTDAGGTQRHYTAESDKAFGAARDAGEFHYDTAATPANIAEGIKIAISGSHSFDASRSDAEVTITTSAAGVGGNQSNFFLDAPGKTSDITITDFTGGTTMGTSTAMTAGKFLIRVEGFMAF